MRIQHNITAMNAYRNYNNNTSALAKNLEKLSSGYKINRAGDDAAGLAISEKMRAQITGLEAAQKNVKDGVSLVKTAEGAMQEIQDMLNRMDYLATQSANGTYDNEVDRANLQKEVDALKTEINRIADSANFNGIKLLDGSLDSEIKDSATLKLGQMTAASTSMILPGVDEMGGANGANGTAGANGTTAANGASATKEPVKTSFAINLNDLDIKWENVKDATTGVADNGTVRFTLNFGKKTAADPVGTAQKDIALSFDFTGADAKKLFNDDGQLNVDKLVDALNKDLNSDATKNSIGLDDEGYAKLRLDVAGVGTTVGADGKDTYSGFDIKVDTDTNQLLFKLHDIDSAHEEEMNLNWNNISEGIRFDVGERVTANGATTTTIKGSDRNNVAIDSESRVNGWKDGMKDPSGVIGTNTIVYNNVGETRKTEFTVNLEDLEWKVTPEQLTEKGYMFKIDFGSQYLDATGTPKNGALKVTFTKDEMEKLLVDTDNDGKGDKLDSEALVDAIIGGLMGTNPAYDYTHEGDGLRVDVAGVCDHSKPNGGYSGFDIVKSENGKGLKFILHDETMAHPAEANANWGDVNISVWGTNADNPTIADYNIQKAGGDGSHGWSVGTTDMKDGVLPGQNTFANTVLNMKDTGFDIDNAANNDGYTISADGKTFVLAVGDDSEVAKADLSGTGAIVVKVNKGASVDKQLQELANAMNKHCETWEVGATDRNSTANYGLSFRQREDGATSKDKAGHDLTTVKGIAESISYGKANVKSVKAGKPLTLQIGDTSDEFNQMKVSVGDMHSDAMGIGDVDISTQDGAAAAVQKIKDAINYVSDVRGTLGATQNRLEHTQNNLSVMAENIQDAESTIRDTDVAEEMMNYVKNNILVQSAQAMLAQANQLPQGVLQLLG